MHSETEPIQLLDEKRPKTAQLSGLALIENLYFRAGQEAAQGQLQRLLGADQSLRSYALCEAGEPAMGMNMIPTDEITYENFSPPVSWNAVYAIQRVHLGQKMKSDFLFHPGEEVFVPTRGEVSYHFFWSPGASPPERFLLNPPIAEGQILRINPQIPHHAWSAKGEATGWLIQRHTMNSPVALVMDQNSTQAGRMHSESMAQFGKGPKQNRSMRRRRVSVSDLRKPGAYAMIAWGISELIRDARLKAGLTPTDLARQIGVDPSSISRLEEVKANVSVEMLSKVCGALRIGMTECMESGSWIYDRDRIDLGSPNRDQIVKPPRGAHYLHLAVLRMGQGTHRSVPTGWGGVSGTRSSWIVLGGRLMAELKGDLGGKSMILEAENVLHFRKYGDVLLHAIDDATILQIVCSPICDCKSKVPSAS